MSQAILHHDETSALTRRARLIPDDAVAQRNLGIACYRAGRDGQALIELLTASLLGHEDSEMLAVMGRIHSCCWGRPVEAQQGSVAQLDERPRKLELDLQQRTNDLSATPPKE